MENYTLSEAKKLFASLYKDGKKEEAALLAREIMEKSPEAVSGYYYALVVETDNFKKPGDDSRGAAFRKVQSVGGRVYGKKICR